MLKTVSGIFGSRFLVTVFEISIGLWLFLMLHSHQHGFCYIITMILYKIYKYAKEG